MSNAGDYGLLLYDVDNSSVVVLEYVYHVPC